MQKFPPSIFNFFAISDGFSRVLDEIDAALRARELCKDFVIGLAVKITVKKIGRSCVQIFQIFLRSQNGNKVQAELASVDNWFYNL